MRNAICILPVLLLLLPACEEDHVHVRIQPKADGTFVRTVTMWRVDPAKPDERKTPSEPLVEGARSVYVEAPDSIDGKLRFEGTFREVPFDLVREDGDERYVNRGGYTVWSCRAGSFAAYRERRPGPTDHWERFRKAAEGMDTVAEILAALARRGLEGEEGLPRLVTWLTTEFPTDMKDMMFLFAGDRGPQDLAEEVGPDAPFRSGLGAFRSEAPYRSRSSAAALFLQLLEERGYLQVGAIPEVMGEAEWERTFFADLVARKMGRPDDEALHGKIMGLTEEERAEGLYGSALADIGMTKEEAEEKLEPIGDLMVDIRLGTDAHLTYELVVPGGALVVSTSGRVEAQPPMVVLWKDTLDDRPVTGIFFATWALPAIGWQKEHLGGVYLQGKPLSEYVTWIESLPEDWAKAWEDAVERLTPGPELAEGLSAIRLTPPAPGEEPPPGEEPAPERGARIILAAIEAAGR
jgi:hypothetical protein